MFGGFKGIVTEITQSNQIKNTKVENILELETTNVKTAWKKNVDTVVTSSIKTAGSLGRFSAAKANVLTPSPTTKQNR